MRTSNSYWIANSTVPQIYAKIQTRAPSISKNHILPPQTGVAGKGMRAKIKSARQHLLSGRPLFCAFQRNKESAIDLLLWKIKRRLHDYETDRHRVPNGYRLSLLFTRNKARQ